MPFPRISTLLLATVSLLPGLPGPGEAAPALTLPSVRGGQIRMSELWTKGPTVLVFLRGFPGYQCPFCQRQLRGFIQQRAEFARTKAQLVFVYPGPSAGLGDRAAERLAGESFPAEFEMLLDPDYALTERYGIRWSAPRETAYPSVFVVGKDGVVQFVQSVRSHGNRMPAADVLSYLEKK